MRRSLIAAAAAIAITGVANAQPEPSLIESVSKIAFGDDGTLFLADWRAGKVHSLNVPDTGPQIDDLFNLVDFGTRLEHVARSRDVTVEAIAVSPKTRRVFVAAAVGTERRPLLVSVSPRGDIEQIALRPSKSIPLSDPPRSSDSFWQRVPHRSFTITDMKYFDARLYVAGIVNTSFASALRVIDPSGEGHSTATIEIYHTTHDQIETRAPIRAMAFATLDGEPSLIAAYMCTPLVTIPLDRLIDGAHVRGITIAELGYGNNPLAIVDFSQATPTGSTPALLVVNDQRSAQVVTIDAVARATARGALTTRVPVGRVEGVDLTDAPISNSVAIDRYSDGFFVIVRRTPRTGELQLVTVDTGAKLRLSDFVSEYNFPDFPLAKINQGQITKMRQEGFPVDVNGNR